MKRDLAYGLMDPLNPFGTDNLRSLSEFYRLSRNPLERALGTIGGSDNVSRLLLESQQTGGLATRMRDPYPDTATATLIKGEHDFGLRHTMKAVETAKRDRNIFVQTLAEDTLFLTRRAALDAFDGGIMRTAQALARDTGTLASVIAATRQRGEIANVATSIVQRMDAMRLTELAGSSFPTPAADLFARHFANAREAAEQLEGAATPEQRAALVAMLLGAVLALLRGMAANTRKELFGLGAFMLFSLACDVNSLIPSEPPPGLTPAQVEMIEETHRSTADLAREFHAYVESEQHLDDAYVAALPRAELKRTAVIRMEPNGHGRTLMRAPEGTLLAVVRTDRRWRLTVYRDPLTDELAQGWIYAPAIRLFDDG